MLERNPEKPRPQGKLNGFMYDHGRVVADSSSYMRLVLGIGSAAAILTDRYRLAQGLHLLGIVTDKLD